MSTVDDDTTTLTVSEVGDALTVPEVRAALGIARDTAYALCKRHGVRLKVGRILLLPRAQLEKLLEHGDAGPLRKGQGR
jgi:hypothetical protein